jgi:hypothetical protein
MSTAISILEKEIVDLENSLIIAKEKVAVAATRINNNNNDLVSPSSSCSSSCYPIIPISFLENSLQNSLKEADNIQAQVQIKKRKLEELSALTSATAPPAAANTPANSTSCQKNSVPKRQRTLVGFVKVIGEDKTLSDLAGPKEILNAYPDSCKCLGCGKEFKTPQ